MTYSEPVNMRGVLYLCVLAFFLMPVNSHSGAEVASDQERRDTSNFTEIFFAAKKGEVEKVKILIKKGEDVNSRKGFGVTPLILASSYGNTKIVKLLLDAGAEVDTPTANGNTALIHAGINNSWDIVKLLVEYGADVNAIPDRDTLNIPILVNAAWAAPNDIVGLLLEKGADVHYETQFSHRTPLAVAVMAGRDDNVKLLLEYGADPASTKKKSSYDARSAIWHARKKGHISTIKLIEEALEYKTKLDTSSITVDKLVRQIFDDESIQISKEGKDIEKYLLDLNVKDIKLIKNAIFARKCYKFSTLWITEYFEKNFPSYEPRSIKVNMTKIDRGNVKYLKSIEKKIARLPKRD